MPSVLFVCLLVYCCLFSVYKFCEARRFIIMQIKLLYGCRDVYCLCVCDCLPLGVLRVGDCAVNMRVFSNGGALDHDAQMGCLLNVSRLRLR